MSIANRLDQDQNTALVPLSPARHGARRWRRLSDYSFARTCQFVPIVLAEAEVAATAMPLAFMRDRSGRIAPVALMRLHAAHSPFIGPQGQWQAPYIPAILRVHPFSARPSDETKTDGRMVLLVNERTGHVTDNPQDERFFDPFGAPAPALEQVVGFFKHYQANARDTCVAIDALTQSAAADGGSLFQPLQGVGLPDMPEPLGISRAHFAALPDADIGALRESGALGLVMAHFISLHQIGWLDRAEKALTRGNAAVDTHNPVTPAPDVNDFLSALKVSQDRDLTATVQPHCDATKG